MAKRETVWAVCCGFIGMIHIFHLTGVCRSAKLSHVRGRWNPQDRSAEKELRGSFRGRYVCRKRLFSSTGVVETPVELAARTHIGDRYLLRLRGSSEPLPWADEHARVFIVRFARLSRVDFLTRYGRCLWDVSANGCLAWSVDWP